MGAGAQARVSELRTAGHQAATEPGAPDVRDQLQTILDVTHVATWRLDLSSGRLDWSPNSRQVLGLDADVPLDTLEDFLRLVVTDDRNQIQGLAEEAVSGAVLPQEWEFRILDGAGVERWMCGRGQVAPGAGATVVSGVVFDITSRRQLQGQLRDHERTLSGIVDASPDGIVVSGLDGEIRFASVGVRDVLGMEPEELRGRRTWEYVEPAMHDAVRACAATLIRDPSAVRQLRLQLRHRDGHTVVVDCRFRLLSGGEGEPAGFVTVVRDVTEQAKLEGELARARRQAEAASRAKSDYIARMSHELRTPMNSVIGFAQVLELSDLSPTDKDSVARILGAGRHLLQLIDEVLDIARVELGTFAVSPEPVHLREVVTAATGLLAPQLEASDLRVSVDVDPDVQVLADRKRLSQVIINLVSNAIKYNRRGGEVRVTGAPSRPGSTRLVVTDTGIGIAESEIPRLFAPFERLGADRTDVEGTGLGLALCRTLTEAMGGSIGCDSTLGQGTAFWVELPAAEDPATIPTEPTARQTPRRQPVLHGGT